MITVSRYHDISCGHRVVGHEGKCKYLHGHNYRIHFTARRIGSDKDDLGRVINFSVLKTTMCQWLEDGWDHKTLLWTQDPWLKGLQIAEDNFSPLSGVTEGLVAVELNPTAENLAWILLHRIAPLLLAGTEAQLIGVRIEETSKCSAEVILAPYAYR